MLKILIADDNSVSRQLLRQTIETMEDVKVVGEAENGQELVEMANRLKPHLNLVDLDMPVLNGLDAIRQLAESNPRQYYVIITGHPDYALEAFNLYSFDYILKPFNPERVIQTISKIKDKFKDRGYQLLVKALNTPQKLYVKSGNEILFIDTQNIIFIEKENKKTVIHTTDNKYETNEDIKDLEKRLNQNYFFRSHKSYLINLKMVEKLVVWGDTAYIVKFTRTNKDALMSKKKVRLLQNLLNID